MKIYNNTEILLEKLSDIGLVLSDEPLYKHCSFKIGGNAKFFLTILNEPSLKKFLQEFGSEKFFVLGGGTNILFSDDGYDGIIVKLGGEFNEIKVSKNKILSGSATSLSAVLKTAVENKLSGLECVAGIPGSVGGAIFGNAGSRDKWLFEAVESVDLYKDCKKILLSKEQINFGYRKSGIENCIITKVKFALKKEPQNNKTLDFISENIRLRNQKQPLNFPNAGSIFKNPDGVSAGKLIEECGLKGEKFGGAEISKLHANFIINTGNASSEDILNLVCLIQKKVFEKFKIKLETEIKIINE
jgi:UDP-N-acetylmuramate dehydrogenase